MPDELTEAGRMISNANAAKLRAAAHSILDILSASGNEPKESLDEAGRSFGDRSRLIRAALTAGAPDRTYCYISDLYDDSVVYSLGDFGEGSLYQRDYTIDDNGKVTFGDPVKVMAQTVYTPTSESEAGGAASLTERDMQQLKGGKVDLDKLPAADFAGKNRSYPIVTPADVTAAAHAIGRAGSDNYSTDELKSRIIAIAKRKGASFVAALPDAWKPKQESRFEPTPLDFAILTEVLGDNGHIIEAGNEQALIDSFGKWAAGSQADCVSALSGKAGISDPNALCAWMKDRYTGSTKWRGKHKESAEAFTGDLVPLVEKAVTKDGKADICLITPGWGSSGHYSAEMLKRDGPKVFTANTQMFADHPSESEAMDRPERTIKDLMGTLAEDAHWEDDGANGPGLYAKANILKPYADSLDALAPHIGVSIRASGEAQEGEADGKKGRIISRLVNAASVDFVTKAGRGGKVLPLMESIRNGQPIQSKESNVDLTEAQTKIASLEEALAKQNEIFTAQANELAKLRERALIGDATAFVTSQLQPVRLPEITKQRLVTQLTSNPPVKENELDREALAESIKSAVADATEYLAAVVSTGRISGFGSVAQESAVSEADLEKQYIAALMESGMSEAAATAAARS